MWKFIQFIRNFIFWHWTLFSCDLISSLPRNWIMFSKSFILWYKVFSALFKSVLKVCNKFLPAKMWFVSSQPLDVRTACCWNLVSRCCSVTILWLLCVQHMMTSRQLHFSGCHGALASVSYATVPPGMCFRLLGGQSLNSDSKAEIKIIHTAQEGRSSGVLCRSLARDACISAMHKRCGALLLDHYRPLYLFSPSLHLFWGPCTYFTPHICSEAPVPVLPPPRYLFWGPLIPVLGPCASIFNSRIMICTQYLLIVILVTWSLLPQKRGKKRASASGTVGHIAVNL